MTLHWSDPGHSALRKASRLAVVMTAMNVLGHVVLHNATFATFASFGSMALLLFADFDGPTTTRLRLGVGFTAIGAVLVALGTVAAGHLAWVVLLLFAVGFVVTFAGAYGGDAATGGKGLILAAVLSAMVPPGSGALLDRLGGWVAAGLVGSISLVVLWPARERPLVRTGLSESAGELASLIRMALDGAPVSVDAVDGHLAELRGRIDAALSRPGGPRSRDRALLHLLDDLGRASVFVRRLDALGTAGPVPAASRTAIEASAAALDAAAATLVGRDVDPHADRLDSVRDVEAHDVRALLEHASNGPTGGGAALASRFDQLFPVRMLTYVCSSISANALVAVGRDPGDTSFEFQLDSPAVQRSWRATLSSAADTLREHLRPSSRWFRASLRAGLALGASAAIATIVDPSHAFWVVLGTLSALRSSLADTGATALQSVTGTVIGFAGATLTVIAVGDQRAVLWVLLPLLIVMAGLLPTAVSFLAGQAAFTVLVVVLFNLSDPVGWEVGVVRLERVGLGVAVSVVVAMLIWPRGVSHGLARAAAQEYRTTARYLRSTVEQVLTGRDVSSSDIVGNRRSALAARARAEGELGDLMGSDDRRGVRLDTWAMLIDRPATAVVGGDSLQRSAARQPAPPAAGSDPESVSDTSVALGRAAEVLTGSMLDVAQRLDAAAGLPTRRGEHDEATRGGRPDSAAAAPSTALGEARSRLVTLFDDPTALAQLSDHQLVGLVAAYEWLRLLAEVNDEVAAALDEVCQDVDRSWWR